MELSSHLDLLSVGVAVASTALLGFVILFNKLHSATNRAFFYFTMVTACWSIVNYSYYQLPAGEPALWLLRLVMFFATWHAFTFFHLASVFPKDDSKEPWWHIYVLMPLAGTVSILTLTPYVFEHVNVVNPDGSIGGVQNGPAIALFGLLVLYLVVSAISQLVRKTVVAPSEARRPYTIMLGGMVITFALLLTFNFFIPATFNNPQFIPFGAFFLLPFVMMTSYAIYQHHLFNLKVAATAFLGFMVTIFTFVNVLYSTSPSSVAVNVTAFAIVLLGSIKIVRDTLALGRLAEALQETNVRQETLIHFIGHEVKGFLTKAEAAFAALGEGDFGTLPEGLKPFVTEALKETRHGVTSVSDILKAANQKKGTIEYDRAPFDLREVSAEVVAKAKASAAGKGLTLSFSADDSHTYEFTGDKVQIAEHVLRNLLDNAITYTSSGSVTVLLHKEAGMYILAVKDTGVGITEEDRAHLFTEGGHGRESQKANIHSTGYGLFIAKNVIEAHGGTIRVESEGPGHGSTFIVELPA